MAIRALIIAIENYGQVKAAFGKRLVGTHDAASSFRSWLIETKHVEPANILFCAEDPAVLGRTSGATADDISRAIYALWTAGRDQTEELYFFFSGHGFLFEVSGARDEVVDILVAADFENAELSGNACRKLLEIREHLRAAMGPGEHFYFIDACRNRLKAEDIAPGSLGLRPHRSKTGDANPFTLYSTSRNAFAAVVSRFPEELVTGLCGTGNAKAWDGDDLVVSFGSLTRYLRERVSGQDVDGRPGQGPGVILRIEPIPRYICGVEIEGAEATDRFDVRVATSRGLEVAQGPNSFSGMRFTLPALPPDSYTLALTHKGVPLEAIGSPRVELFDNAVIRFRMPPPAGPSTLGLPAIVAGPRFASVRVVTALGVRDLAIRDLASGKVSTVAVEGQKSVTRSLVPGRYEFSVLGQTGETLRSRELNLGAGHCKVSLKPASAHPAKRALRDRFGSGWEMNFSESLGIIEDNDLAVWLAILGAARILADPERPFRKLNELPLASFEDARLGAAPIYVLASLKGARSALSFALGVGDESRWLAASRVEGFTGLQQLCIETEPGPQIFTFVRPGGHTSTVMTHTFPNRATLVTLSDSEGALRLHQYALPLYAQRLAFVDDVNEMLFDEPLRKVRYLAQAQHAYKHGRALAPLVKNIEESRYWSELLSSKWLEPITSTIAAYELVRRGRNRHLNTLKIVVGNLRRLVPGLADVEILAAVAGLKDARPDGTPMLLDGLLSLEDWGDHLPLPENRLDYSSFWTSWVGAVARQSP